MAPEPSATEWVVAAGAAALIVTLGGLHLLRLYLRPGVTAASRVAGFLLATLSATMVLIAAVLVGAGIRASKIDPAQLGEDRPVGTFAHYLFNRNPDTTERVGQYSVAILLPFAATLGVLALAAIDRGRSIGLRAIAAGVCAALLVLGFLVAAGDAGPLASRTAIAVAVLAAAGGAAIAVDELANPRRS